MNEDSIAYRQAMEITRAFGEEQDPMNVVRSLLIKKFGARWEASTINEWCVPGTPGVSVFSAFIPVISDLKGLWPLRWKREGREYSVINAVILHIDGEYVVL